MPEYKMSREDREECSQRYKEYKGKNYIREKTKKTELILEEDYKKIETHKLYESRTSSQRLFLDFLERKINDSQNVEEQPPEEIFKKNTISGFVPASRISVYRINKGSISKRPSKYNIHANEEQIQFRKSRARTKSLSDNLRRSFRISQTKASELQKEFQGEESNDRQIEIKETQADPSQIQQQLYLK